MNKIGIKINDVLDYEQFENFQYVLDYDFEYDELLELIREQRVIKLDIDNDEDRAEDIEVLKELLLELDNQNIRYQLYAFNEEWREQKLSELK